MLCEVCIHQEDDKTRVCKLRQEHTSRNCSFLLTGGVLSNIEDHVHDGELENDIDSNDDERYRLSQNLRYQDVFEVLLANGTLVNDTPIFCKAVNLVGLMLVLPLAFAKALHGACEEHLVDFLQELLVPLKLMDCVVHPLLSSSIVFLDLISTVLSGVPTFHRERLLLKAEDQLKGEVKHKNDDTEDQYFLISPLERSPMPVFPNDVRWLRSFLHFNLMIQ